MPQSRVNSGLFGIGWLFSVREKWSLFLVRRELKDMGGPCRPIRAAETLVYLERWMKGPPFISTCPASPTPQMLLPSQADRLKQGEELA